MQNSVKKKTSGSTFLIILGVLGLLVIALAFIIPRVIAARSRSTLIPCKSNLKNIGTAMDMYSTDWSGKYPSSLTELVPNYLKTIPECYDVDGPSYRLATGPNVGYNTQHLQDYYILWCAGDHHQKKHGLQVNFPQYDSLKGLMEEPPSEGARALLPSEPSPAPTEPPPAPTATGSPNPSDVQTISLPAASPQAK